MRRLALLLLLLLPAPALAEQPGLHCVATAIVRCENGTCGTLAESAMQVTFWPEPTPVEQCRAMSCEPDPPRIAVCDFTLDICGSGTVHYTWSKSYDLDAFKTGMAYLVPDPPPRLHASTHFALAYDPPTGRLALSRFDGNSVDTTWLLCTAE